MRYENKGIVNEQLSSFYFTSRVFSTPTKRRPYKICGHKYITILSWGIPVEYITINRLTPNDPYMGRTAPLPSKRCILYIYSTNIGTEYFKHALYCPFFSLQNAVCFIMLACLVPVLFTFYTQSVLKLKKNNSGAKGLIKSRVRQNTTSLLVN